MNVISRREHESVVIGDDLVITVLEVANDRVRLAIETSDAGYREETLFWSGANERAKVLDLLVATH